MRLDAQRRVRVSCVLAVSALVLTGCAHVAHTYGSILPAGTPFRVNLWGGPESSVGSVAVADDRVAVAWLSSRTRTGETVATVAWARVSPRTGPCGRAHAGDDVRGDVRSLRVGCALGYGAPWRVITVRHIVAPSAVGVAFDSKGPVTAWASRQGVWIAEPNTQPTLAMHGRVSAVGLTSDGADHVVLALISTSAAGAQLRVLERVGAKWEIQETHPAARSSHASIQLLHDGYAVAYTSVGGSLTIEEHRNASIRSVTTPVTGSVVLGLTAKGQLIAAYAGLRAGSTANVVGLLYPETGDATWSHDPCHARPVAVGETDQPLVVLQSGCPTDAPPPDHDLLSGITEIPYGAGTSGPVITAVAGATHSGFTATLERGDGSDGSAGYELALYPTCLK